MSAIRNKCERCAFFRPQYSYGWVGCGFYDAKLPDDITQNKCDFNITFRESNGEWYKYQER